MGHREFVPNPEHSLKAPNWLSHLPHPIGLVAIAAVLAALGWLVVEFWLRGWHHWWFVTLGAFCFMGIYTAVGGRAGTAGLGRPDPGDPYFPNVLGWAFLLAAPAVYGALLIAAGIAIHKINPAYIAAFKSRMRVSSDVLMCFLTLLPGCLVIGTVLTWKAATTPSIGPFLDKVAVSLLDILVLSFILVPAFLFLAGVLIAVMIAAWWILFGSADLVLRRKSYW